MLIRVGRNAIDVDLIARIMDHVDGVCLVFKDGERVELAGEDADAVRDLVASLPSHLPDARFRVECADDSGSFVARLPSDADTGEGRG